MRPRSHIVQHTQRHSWIDGMEPPFRRSWRIHGFDVAAYECGARMKKMRADIRYVRQKNAQIVFVLMPSCLQHLNVIIVSYNNWFGGQCVHNALGIGQHSHNFRCECAFLDQNWTINGFRKAVFSFACVWAVNAGWQGLVPFHHIIQCGTKCPRYRPKTMVI